MKLLNIGALMLAMGLSQAVFAADVGVGFGDDGIIIRIGDRDRDHRGDRDRDRGDWGRDDYRRRSTVCFARNARGIRFSAQGRGPEFVIQRQAVRECRMSYQTRNPYTCRPLGCRTGRW